MYLACKTFGWTVDQYLDTPVEEIEWLLRVHDVYQRAEAKANDQGGPRLPDVPTIA